MFVIRRLRMLIAPALLLAGQTILLAQVPAGAPAPGPAKVAVINLQRAVIETSEIAKAQKDLELKYKPRQDQMEMVSRELQQIQQQLQSGQGKLTPASEQELNMRGQRKQREMQRLQEDLQGEVDRERQDILGRSAQRMNEIVRKLAEAAGYDIVVDSTNAVYFKPAMEITKMATDEYNKAYPVK